MALGPQLGQQAACHVKIDHKQLKYMIYFAAAKFAERREGGWRKALPGKIRQTLPGWAVLGTGFAS
jgi:hypothetical protein